MLSGTLIADDAVDVVQSVDRFSLAQALDRRARAIDRRIEVMLQVNTADSTSQSGAHPDELVELAGRVAELPSLKICGLMTIVLEPCSDE